MTRHEYQTELRMFDNQFSKYSQCQFFFRILRTPRKEYDILLLEARESGQLPGGRVVSVRFSTVKL